METRWYKEGLAFKCTGCGGCCTGAPGYTWVSEEEIEKIADHLDLTLDEFARKYLRRVGKRWSLKELNPSYDCVFLKGKECMIYPVRPTQCQTFPWWPQNLHSEETWAETARECEGIQPDAPLVSIGEIEKERSRQDGASG